MLDYTDELELWYEAHEVLFLEDLAGEML